MTESDNCYVVSFTKLIKCGWIHVDNSALMLLRLLDELSVASIGIAGLDGYEPNNAHNNYVNQSMALANSYDNPIEMNKEIRAMLKDYCQVRKSKDTELRFITRSRFEDAIV